LWHVLRSTAHFVTINVTKLLHTENQFFFSDTCAFIYVIRNESLCISHYDIFYAVILITILHSIHNFKLACRTVSLGCHSMWNLTPFVTNIIVLTMYASTPKIFFMVLLLSCKYVLLFVYYYLNIFILKHILFTYMLHLSVITNA
jgi:hypothetical protein